MSDKYVDPAGNTEQFRKYVDRPEPPAETGSKLPMVIGLAVAGVVLVVLIVWLALG